MPAVPKGKVLVSGCNGYVAVWVVKQLLEDGYAVRGTVRRESAIPYLKELFEAYSDRFEIVIVPDITKVHLTLCPYSRHMLIGAHIVGGRVRRGGQGYRRH